MRKRFAVQLILSLLVLSFSLTSCSSKNQVKAVGPDTSSSGALDNQDGNGLLNGGFGGEDDNGNNQGLINGDCQTVVTELPPAIQGMVSPCGVVAEEPTADELIIVLSEIASSEEPQKVLSEFENQYSNLESIVEEIQSVTGEDDQIAAINSFLAQ